MISTNRTNLFILLTLTIMMISACSIVSNHGGRSALWTELHPFLFPPTTPLTFQEEALLEIQYHATQKQVRALSSLQDQDEIQVFIHEFWEAYDPTPGTLRNEYRDEIVQRMSYVADHYPGRRGWMYSERGRVYILYGPPVSIIRENWLQNDSYKGIEIWLYNRPAGGNPVPPVLNDNHAGQMQFVFADQQFLGTYTQVFSTELGERTDPRLFKLRDSSNPVVDELIEEFDPYLRAQLQYYYP